MAADQIKRACQNYWGGALVLYILADLISFLEIQRLKGKGKGALGKGVLGARQTRGAREE